MSASNVIVVDTNVWLDHALGYRALHEDASKFIVAAREKDLPLVIPSHSLKDVFFIIQNELKKANRADGAQDAQVAADCARKAAWAIIDSIMEQAAVGPSDQSDAWIASKHRAIHSDYEDNLVIATAIRLNARLLVTHDQTLIAHSPVPALSPRDALSLIEME